ncbi:MAG: hypothetical protein AAFV62_08020 [Pseudomonadota bacterium]
METNSREGDPYSYRMEREGDIESTPAGQRGIRAELTLCRALEAEADRLPAVCYGRFNRIVAALRHLAEVRPAAHLMEQVAHLPDASSRGALTDYVHLIAEEDERDADVALELADAMEVAMGAGAAPNPEALGYLMRGFFDSRRRHLAWRQKAFFDTAAAILDTKTFRALAAPLDAVAQDLRLVALV